MEEGATNQGIQLLEAEIGKEMESSLKSAVAICYSSNRKLIHQLSYLNP